MRCNMILTEDEKNRYSRQIRLSEVGLEGQKKIKGSSVLVVGAGGLGCPVLQYLTAAGIGTIGIVDNDWVDETNLQRQVLYTIRDISKPKPLAAKGKLRLLNPETDIKIHFIRMDKESALNIIKVYDIVVDCTDNFATRYLINDACVILNKPIVYGAIERFSGQLTVLNYQRGPTLRCLYPVPPHPLEVPSCEETGIAGSVAGIIGSMQATEVLKIILGQDGVLSGKFFVIDALNFNTQLVTYEKNPENSEISALGDYDDICLSEKSSVVEISVTDLRKMLEDDPEVTIIDLREDKNSESLGFNCISIPFYEINKQISFILNKKTVVFHCQNGIQSKNVINYFQSVHKKKNLYHLIQG